MKIEELGRHYAIIDFNDLFTKSVTNIYYKYGEVGTSSIRAKLVKKNTPIDLTGCRVVINIIDEKGMEIVDTATVLDATKGTIEIVLESIALNTGISFFELTIISEDHKTKKSPRIAYRVLDSLSEDIVIGSEKYPILVNIIKEVDDLHIATNALSDKTTTLNQDVRNLEGEVRQLNTDMNVAEGAREGNEATRNTNEGTRQANETARIANMKKINADVAESLRVNTEKIDTKIVNVQGQLDTKIVEVNQNLANNTKKVDDKIVDVQKQLDTKVGTKFKEVDKTIGDKVVSIDNKIKETDTTLINFKNRFNALAPEQSTNAEVQLARTDSDGVTHNSLNERLVKAETKGFTHYSAVESSFATIVDSVDSKVKDIETLGNTIQDASTLKVKSVGQLQEDGTYKISIVSCGKNINPYNFVKGDIDDKTGLYKSNGGTNSVLNEFIKVKPSVSYRLSPNKTLNSTYATYYEYDENYNFIKMANLSKTGVSNITTSEICRYLKFKYQSVVNLDVEIQVEEGTVATPYEPYKGTKSEIILPCQLDRLESVSDRLYYDEVEKAWCIDKNTKIITDFSKINIVRQPTLDTDNTERYFLDIKDTLLSAKGGGVLNSKLPYVKDGGDESKTCIYSHSTTNRIDIKKLKTDNRWNDVNGLRKFLEGSILKYATTEPQKIVLPLDVQIQLNSYFPKTHIFFEDTEVEGTIKCKVPKSVGASVESNSKELEKVKDRIENIEGLVESQSLKYQTSKDFLVCEDTKSGVIEDLKLSGKTLNNLWNIENVGLNSQIVIDGDFVKCTANGTYITASPIYKDSLKPNTLYTLVFYILKNTINPDGKISPNIDLSNESPFETFISLAGGNTGVFTYTMQTKNSLDGIKYSVRTQLQNNCTSGEFIFNCVLLEGDYTQNPPPYFEGMKSVGQDVNKIEVLSVNTNLFNDSTYKGFVIEAKIPTTLPFVPISLSNDNITLGLFDDNYNNIKDNSLAIGFYNEKKERLGFFSFMASITNRINSLKSININYKDVKYVNMFANNLVPNIIVGGVVLTNSTDLVTDYIPHKTDKKDILCFNTKTQTWNNLVILRGIPESVSDTIEKYNDNKWYYHKRCEEMMLSGTEDLYLIPPAEGQDAKNIRVYMKGNGKFISNSKVICDKLPRDNSFVLDKNLITVDHNGQLVIGIMKSELATADIEGVKKWLTDNKPKFVYQLPQKEVYECNPLFLDSYDSETTLMINSSVIAPKTEFTISSHINNIVLTNKERIQRLEGEIFKVAKMVLSGDMQSLAYMLYPQDFIEETPPV